MIPFENTYALLPERFYARTQPAAAPEPTLVRLNLALAAELKLDTDWLQSEAGLGMLSGRSLPEGAEPIAQAYAGHQFGGWVPQLGDGRAILLGELIDIHGQRRDLQLKGSGRTHFSRGGDGKSTLGAVIREYLVSEGMAALNVPTTRALAAVTTGEDVPRMKAHPGGVFTRVAASHLRVGTFQYFQGKEDREGIQILADYAIERHYPTAAEAEDPYRSLLEQVAVKQAQLIAQWLQLGFIHGVMNTDNMTISGETIDYGPCAFMETFHPDTVFSSIDQQARYAWGNQPNVGHWNLERLADALAPLISEEPATAKTGIEAVLKRYVSAFTEAYFGGFGKKLGMLKVAEKETEFINNTLRFMAENQLDFTLFFRHLTRLAEGPVGARELQDALGALPGIEDWLVDWQVLADTDVSRRGELMRASNPILIPRNHRVEQAIQDAERGDFDAFHRLADALTQPFVESSEFSAYEAPAEPHEVVCETFCGT